jgi:hypothetical protein
MILRMDSKAAIGVISKGHVSERKRVRTAGRAWVNFCRYEMLEKNQDIMIQHVSSHKGTETTEQRGNDAADIIANEYRRIGESSSARPYFTAAEEQFVLNQNGTNVQGDPRRFLKSIEIHHMKEIWEQKAPKQARWTSQYPTQILKQSKRVWTWAAAAGKGSAWIYYIFAISQWLPTNHRVHYSDTGELDLHKCKLCLLNLSKIQTISLPVLH